MEDLLTMKTAEELIHDLSRFFDDQETAERIVRCHLHEHEGQQYLIASDGTPCVLEKFVERHRKAYGRRIAHGIPHRLETLLCELEQKGFLLFGHSPSRTPTLEEYDRRIDPAMKQAWFNARASRKTPRD